MKRTNLDTAGLCAIDKRQQDRETLNDRTRVPWNGTHGPGEGFGVQERGEADCFVEIVCRQYGG